MTQQPRRKRGVILTPQGKQKLLGAIREFEQDQNFGAKYTIEELSSQTGLDPGTVAKVLDAEERADRRTIDRFFQTYSLELAEADYCSPRFSPVPEVVTKKKQIETFQNSDSESQNEVGWDKETSQRFWNVPQSRNTFFTGRDEVFRNLRNILAQNNRVVLTQLQAISGLGGIGKTQTAVEYAYRYANLYQAVFWVKADDPLSLSTGFIEIAKLLNLPQKDAQDPEDAVRAVKSWLESAPNWLLILDSADDPAWVKAYLPRQIQGHILVTSRSQDFQALGITQPIEIRELSLHEAVQFLFKRTRCCQDDPTETQAATELAQELGCLPLALEQAGAYIQAQKARLQDYLASYRKRHLALLEKARPIAGNYPQSVLSTWALNFREVEQISLASADLMRLTAFLDADKIPYELITQGISELGLALRTTLSKVADDPLVLNETLEPLTRYSLIRLDRDNQSYSTHRLVQAVLRSQLEPDARQLWAERTVRVVSQVFPEVSYDAWLFCERLLTHAKTATKLIEDFQFNFEEAAKLLHRTGRYLYQRARYTEAAPLLEQVLRLRKYLFGEEHPDVVNILHDLAWLHYSQGHYAEAEPLFKQVLETRKRLLGEEHPDVARTLHDLAVLYHYQGRYSEAEPLFEKSLILRRCLLGEEHQDVAASLHNFGNLYKFQGRYSEAEALYLQAIELRRHLLGEKHPDFADSLNNLALLYYYQGRYTEAEPLYLQVLEFDRERLGEEHTAVATTLNNLALLYHAQSRYAEAEKIFLRSLNIRQILLGDDHPLVAQSLNNLGGVYESQEHYSKAEQLYRHALELEERLLGNDHPDLADSLNDLAGLQKIYGRYTEAEALYSKALTLAQSKLGNDHPFVAASLYGLGSLRKLQGQHSEAKQFLSKALEISERISGINHPKTVFYRTRFEELNSTIM